MICRKSKRTCACLQLPEAAVRVQSHQRSLVYDDRLFLGAQPADTRARSLSADDLQTSKRLRRARGRDEDEEEEEEPGDDSDAELFAHVKKLDIRPPPTPAKANRRQKLNNNGEDLESDEDVRPPATRATSRMKAKGKARETAPRRR